LNFISETNRTTFYHVASSLFGFGQDWVDFGAVDY